MRCRPTPNAPPRLACGLNEGVPVTSRAHKRQGRQKAACHRSGSLPLKKIWSGRRGSNPRPRPWQGRALPLSYTRIRDGGERSPSTADLCQMPTVNATVRMRSNAARIIRFHQQWPRIGPKQRRNRVCRAAPAHAGSPAARHRRNAGRFDPFFPYQPPNDGRAARPPHRNRRALAGLDGHGPPARFHPSGDDPSAD